MTSAEEYRTIQQKSSTSLDLFHTYCIALPKDHICTILAPVYANKIILIARPWLCYVNYVNKMSSLLCSRQNRLRHYAASLVGQQPYWGFNFLVTAWIWLVPIWLVVACFNIDGNNPGQHAHNTVKKIGGWFKQSSQLHSGLIWVQAVAHLLLPWLRIISLSQSSILAKHE